MNGVATTLDGQRQFRIPPDEILRAARDGLVVTTRYADDKSSTDLHIYDVVSGAAVRQVTLAQIVTEAILIGGDVYFVGSAPDGPPWRDLGVSALPAGVGAAVSLTQGRDAEAQWARGLLSRSPSDRFIATQLEPVDDHMTRTGSPVIEITSLADKTTVEVAVSDTNLFAISDVTVLTRSERMVTAYSRDGARAWTIGADGTQEGYLTADGSRLVQPLLDSHWRVMVVDARTGQVEKTFVMLDGDVLSPDLSTDRYAVFPILDEPGSYRFLDLETGFRDKASVRIDTGP